MIIDASIPPVGLKDIPGVARAADEMGFGALWTMETMHDPFLPGALIAEHTSRIQFGTGIAIAFSRSPANLAYTAWDLQEASGGRFILGLGTQVKAHIERRYGMPWPESPVAKLREQIKAVRSFWNTWQTGEPLRFQGEYYRLSLMTPFFNPGPIEHPDIPIFIAGVNTGLAKLAGELCDGFVAHPFHSARYLREVVLPAIQSGREKADRSSRPFQVSVTAFAASNEGQREFIRQQIAFYASTPSYRAVMNLHGWTETAENLSAMAARGGWSEMPAQITDEMLSTFAVLCDDEADLPEALRERYEGLADRLGMYLPFIPGENDKFWESLIASAG